MRRLLLALSIIASLALGISAGAQTIGVPPTTMDGSVAVIVNGWPYEPAHRPPEVDYPDANFEQWSDRVFRDSLFLGLKIDGSKTLALIDKPCSTWGGESCFGHRFHSWWPTLRYYVVDVRLWEGRSTYLVAERDGLITKVVAPPVLSPSGHFAIAADLSPAYGNGLELIDMRAKPPAVIKIDTQPACPGTHPQSWLRPKPRWLDETRIVFEGSYGVGAPMDSDAKQILRIVDGKPEWEC